MLLAAMALAAETPTLQGPEPILELAQKDVRRLRQARSARVAATLMPVFIVTGLVVVNNSDFTGDDAAPAQAVGGMILGGLGVFGATASATVLHLSTVKSRRLLTQQGLTPRRLVPVVVPVLIGVGAVSGIAAVDPTGQVPNLVSGTVAIGSFAVAVGLSSLQGQWNANARREAGWVVVPVVGRTPGMQVAGRW